MDRCVYGVYEPNRGTESVLKANIAATTRTFNYQWMVQIATKNTRILTLLHKKNKCFKWYRKVFWRMIWYARYRHFILQVNASIVGYDLFRLHNGKYTLLLDFIFVIFLNLKSVGIVYYIRQCTIYLIHLIFCHAQDIVFIPPICFWKLRILVLANIQNC